MYRVSFKNVGEVRMGSPYNVADVSLEGIYLPDLGKFEFQDKGCVSSSGDQVILVQWAIENNDPGFILWKISANDKAVWKSERIRGICENVSFSSEDCVEISLFDPEAKGIRVSSVHFE